MKLDQKLNLVIPIGSDQTVADPKDPKKTVTVFVPEFFVHSMPIGREVFEKFYLVIAKTFSSIYNEGLGFTTGPRVAMLMLRSTASSMGQLEEVERGLIAEIRRLTNVVMVGQSGWETVPFQEVVDKKIISEDDLAEVENALAFFTVASSMHKKKDLLEILDGAGTLWGAQTSLLSCTEYAASLRTSTATGTSSPPAPPSQVPR